MKKYLILIFFFLSFTAFVLFPSLTHFLPQPFKNSIKLAPPTNINYNMAVMTDHDRSHNLRIKTLPTPPLTKDGGDMCTVPEFFAHKNIFVTGGTGFLGTVLIEALLDSTPDIGTIYMLVRGKKHLNPNDRIKRLLQKPVSKQKEAK